MRGRFSIVFLTYVIALTASAFAAPREKAGMPSVRPLAVAAETKAEMARYGAVFSRGQSPVDSRWIHGGKQARCIEGTSRGTWRVPPEVKAALFFWGDRPS